jgi:hypothetical protein
MKGHVDQFTGEVSRLSAEQKQGLDTLYELHKITQEINQIEAKHTKSVGDTGPAFDRQAFAGYMMEHNLNDAQKAYELMYGLPVTQAQLQQAKAEQEARYNQGKADAEQALANRRVTTETSSGTPWRMRTGEGRSTHPPNSQERKQEILDRAAERIGAPRETASW